jgi:uncharacterized protein
VAGHLRTLLAVGDVEGAVDALEDLLEAEPERQAIALVGDLAGAGATAETYRTLFKALGGAATPAYWVPGRNDAPLSTYLRESYNLELVFEQLRGVHATAALGVEDVLFAGLGGELVDDPAAARDEETTLRYPAWGAEYRLKVVRDFDAHSRVFLFSTTPAHKGLERPGSEVLAELVNSYAPRVAVVAGDEPGVEQLGTTLVVCPGRLGRGEYALVDLLAHTADPRTIGQRAGA